MSDDKTISFEQKKAQKQQQENLELVNEICTNLPHYVEVLLVNSEEREEYMELATASLDESKPVEFNPFRGLLLLEDDNRSAIVYSEGYKNLAHVMFGLDPEEDEV